MTRQRYSAREMALDSSRLIEHLGHERVDIMGYSMGARLTALLGIHHPQQARSLVIARAGGQHDRTACSELAGDCRRACARLHWPRRRGSRAGPSALLPSRRSRTWKRWRPACRRTGCLVSREELGAIKAPALIVAGEEDTVAGPVDPLVEAMPGCGRRGAARPRPHEGGGRQDLQALGTGLSGQAAMTAKQTNRVYRCPRQPDRGRHSSGR